jgi:murein DD-endopeptidase MepM/ murein hydrolase activator NlpD
MNVDEVIAMAGAAAGPTATPAGFSLAAAPGAELQAAAADPLDITRITELHTYIPDRPRLEILDYVVETDDTILGIATKFGISPETVVFSNPILRDNPHMLEPAQTLHIAPANGIIREVIPGDTLNGLARVYQSTPEKIINWASNSLNPDNPQIAVGQLIFVPDGTRGLLQFNDQALDAPASDSAPLLTGGGAGPAATRPPPDQPYVLRSGAGQCAGGYSGVSGSGSFIYPTGNHFLSGYDFIGIHTGIDLDADQGQPVYAADSGIVMFAGWSDWGYGNTVILDHGNKFYTLYGHLSAWFVSCGQVVYQGNQIAASGNTGRSAGAHLHFEIYYGAFTTNPWNWLPPP